MVFSEDQFSWLHVLGIADSNLENYFSSFFFSFYLYVSSFNVLIENDKISLMYLILLCLSDIQVLLVFVLKNSFC